MLWGRRRARMARLNKKGSAPRRFLAPRDEARWASATSEDLGAFGPAQTLFGVLTTSAVGDPNAMRGVWPSPASLVGSPELPTLKYCCLVAQRGSVLPTDSLPAAALAAAPSGFS